MKQEQNTILVVDDNEMNRDMLSRRLIRQGYRVATAEDGDIALDMLRSQPYGLVLLDIMMPRVDGYRVLEQLKGDELLRHLPVIMITAMDELDSAVRCIEMGAEDYLPKPFNPVLLKARVKSSLDRKSLHDLQEAHRQQLNEKKCQLEHQVLEQVDEILSAQLAAIFAMSKLAESKDPETGVHLERMREYCKVLSGWLAKTDKYHEVIDSSFIDAIYAASPLHDIGKVGVPDAVLLKPGKLDADEWSLMKTHTSIGAETLRKVHKQHPGNAFIEMGIDIAECHHEKWNGSGYPCGLAGEEIPLAARILALGDVYDALTSKRCYKEPFSHETARTIILEGRNEHFDPLMVDAFLEMEQDFIAIRRHFHDPEI